MMSHPGYLTRRDKMLIAVGVVVAIPLATLGFAYLALGAFVAILGAILFYLGRGVWELITGRRKSPDLPLRRVAFTQLMAEPATIRHVRTNNTTPPGRGEP